MKRSREQMRIRWALCARYHRSRVAEWRVRSSGQPETRGLRPRRVVVALAADYGNLGDVAITIAQRNYLMARYPDAQVVEMPIGRTTLDLPVLVRSLQPGDIVTLVGGGNMGDRYDDIEYLRQLVVRRVRSNEVLSFPQTFDFSNGRAGRRALRRAKRAYESHPNLTLMARDPESLRLMRRHLRGCKTVLAPDVVLTETKGLSQGSVKSGVVVAFREDSERALSPHDRHRILRIAAEQGPVLERDTQVDEAAVAGPLREAALEAVLGDFQSACLVLTDRLHGMIFAVITGTPCVAFDNGTQKVSRFYKAWLSGMPGLSLVDEVSDRTLRAAVTHALTDCRDIGPALASVRKQFDAAFDVATS